MADEEWEPQFLQTSQQETAQQAQEGSAEEVPLEQGVLIPVQPQQEMPSAYPPEYGGIYEIVKDRRFIYAILVLGVFLLLMGMVKTPKLDPKIAEIAKTMPDKEITALIFCKTCEGIDGVNIAPGRVLVVGRAGDIASMAAIEDVIQIRYVGEKP